MAPLSPIAPRGQGVALRCYPSALLGDMGLVFLPNGDRSQAIDLSDAIFRFLSFSDHIYGNKKAAIMDSAEDHLSAVTVRVADISLTYVLPILRVTIYCDMLHFNRNNRSLFTSPGLRGWRFSRSRW